MNRSSADWEGLFDEQFQKLKQQFEKDYPGRSYERNHPAEAAYAEFHRSLPAPVRLTKVHFSTAPWHRVEGNLGSLISFDLDRLGVLAVELIDAKKVGGLQEFIDFLQADLGITWGDWVPDEEFPLTQFGAWDATRQWFTLFLPFDVDEHPEKLYHEMWLLFRTSIWMDLSKRLTFEVEFNSVYGLSADPVLPRRQILKAANPGARRFDMMYPEEGEVPLTMKTLQKDVAGFQLIPSVPPGIREVFNTAKRLYVFSYFDQSFAQAAELYSTVAVEAALRERYWSTVKLPVTVTSGRESRRLDRAEHWSIFNLARTTPGWNLGSVRVNGAPFLHTQKQLLDFAETEGYLTHWERDMCHLLLMVRNSHAHTSSIGVTPSNKRWLEMAARFINTLFMSRKKRRRMLAEHRRKLRLRAT